MAGDNIGALLRGVNRDEIRRGQVLAKPGTVSIGSKFEAEIYALNKDEGGRHTPFMSNYRPQFFIFLATMIAIGATLSRAAHGNFPFLLSVAVLDSSIATALLGSSIVFWQEKAFSK